MKRNWIQERLVAILLDNLKDPGVTNSMILLLNQFLRREMLGSLRMLSLMGEIRIGMLLLKRNMLIFPLLSLTLIRLLYLTLFKMQIQIKTISKNLPFQKIKLYLLQNLRHYGDPLEKGEVHCHMITLYFFKNMSLALVRWKMIQSTSAKHWKVLNPKSGLMP